MNIQITSDSTCDLSQLVEANGIKLMPLNVHLDMETYLDGVDITPLDIFDFVERTGNLPKTSAPSQADYENFFAKTLESCDEILHFNISSKCSVSHNNAKAAAEKFGGKVYVVDSLALSSGQGLLVMKAVECIKAGASASETVEVVNGLRDKVNTSFVPDKLDYLHKGGRCSRMTKYAANFLGIHPIIEMKDGALGTQEKCRGKMAICIRKYISYLKEKYPAYDKTRCFITHSHADPELVELAKKLVAENFVFDEINETIAGSIVTSHCGRNTLGVLFIAE